tara:strand:- start:2404 stop:3282 length:879 start_codon:yes stop_codon:yes gene_type:complete
MITSKLSDKIIIGTAQFGLNYGVANLSGKLKIGEIKKIINYARKNKILNIDTANAYGDCEKRLGKVGINDFDVIVKLPALKPTYPYVNWVKNSIRNSFKKLKINKADTILVHNTKYLLNSHMGNKIYQELNNHKNRGIIKNIGVSVYSISELKKVINKFKIDVVLISLNIFDQRILNKKILSQLKRKKIKIYTRSTFLQGLLLISKKNIPTKFMKWKKIINSWHNELNKKKLSAYDVCLNFALSNKDIDRTIIGIDNFKQFKDIFRKKNKIKFNYNKFNSNKINTLINPSKW